MHLSNRKNSDIQNIITNETEEDLIINRNT